MSQDSATLTQDSATDRFAAQPGLLPTLLFGLVLVAGIAYSGQQMAIDLSAATSMEAMPYIILGVALLIALGFEFVNGFHDTANAVATVIYTNSLPPPVAVVWSGLCNLAGVLTSSGAVAFGILSLLPVELILQVGSHSGMAMVFALLIAAILWNLGTWYLGLPASSSHTLIGSIIGVGLMNQFMAPAGSATSGIDWSQASKVGYSLLLSPVIGFALSAFLLMAVRPLLAKKAHLFEAPKGNKPPPLWIRALLVVTCSGVSFAHGSNDGQKGMGLIMLILIGSVPTAYALNRAVEPSYVQTFAVASGQAMQVLDRLSSPDVTIASVDEARGNVTAFLRDHQSDDKTVPSLRRLGTEVLANVTQYPSLAQLPSSQMPNIRNDIYLESDALRLLSKSQTIAVSSDDQKSLDTYKKSLDHATRFIPSWVKVAVALALGLGTMVGWKRIVITVGEKIGKAHLTYAQGAAAELVAMTTIGLADGLGLPVSTTHVLASGVAGTMAANKSGLQWGTLRNLAMAWVLTLPVSIILSGSLFWLLRQVF